jgi:putative ABC transport system permease protein
MNIKNLFRPQFRNKTVLITSITGLSIGLAATILLVVYIISEWSYDRYFTNAGRICRLNSIMINEGNKTVSAINLRKAYTDIPRDIPGIENSVQIYRGGKMEISRNQVRFANNDLLYADSTFFGIFDFRSAEGDLLHSLDNPNSIVLTKKLASKIFGDQPATGQIITIEKKDYIVSSVMEDVPVNTHFRFDILIPMESLEYLKNLEGLEFFTYYLLNSNVDQKSTCSMICDENTKILKDLFKSFNYDFSSGTESLKNIHLFSAAPFDLSRQGNIQTIILVGVIAFMVLFLALTNFINLFVIEGEQRTREIGIRKVSGAGKANLFRQFFSEVTLIVTASFFTGLMLSVFLLHEFGSLMQREFPLSAITTPVFLLSLSGVFLLTIILSGSYPSFYLSRLQPVSAIQSKAGRRSRKKYAINLAGGIQLVITLFLFTALFGINKEIRYLKSLSPGFNPEGLLNIYNLNDKMKSQYAAIKDKLLGVPEVAGVAASSHTIGGGWSGQGIRLLESPADQMMEINEYRIQAGLCELLQLNLNEGRFFDPERPADRNGVILNEAAVRRLGLSSALGREVVMFDKPMEVIGVVKNFRYESAAKIIQPLVLTSYSKDIRTIMIRIAPNVNTSVALQKIGQTLKSFDSGYIMSSRATSDIFKEYYADEERIEQLTKMGAILSLIIVMMGIFVLVSQNLAMRTKEIGIRKVLGGSTARLLIMIYSNSVMWTLTAAIIAIPLSYLYLQHWLKNFVEKTPLSWWIFLSGLAMVLAMEILITFFHTWRETSKNPVESLRYE